MSRKKRKKQSRAILSCKKRLAWLGLICAVQMLPQTVLAEDAAEQVNPKNSTEQTEITDSAGQIDPADEAAPNNTTDSAEISESIFENRKEKTVEGVPANMETWAEYNDVTDFGNPHSVCIVGWDDDYDAGNFRTAPPGNGAWIVKNSYGSQTDLIPGGLVYNA